MGNSPLENCCSRQDTSKEAQAKALLDTYIATTLANNKPGNNQPASMPLSLNDYVRSLIHQNKAARANQLKAMPAKRTGIV
jgi:hypothetical protein